jgi:CrcB protein
MGGSELILVALGGGVGSLARWLAGLAVGKRWKGAFPLGTFLVNISGAFLIGFLTVFFKFDWTERFGQPANALVLTGVLGGYTTFSSMELDAGRLLDEGQTRLGMAYLFGTVALGLAAAFLGGTLASLLLRGQA